MRLAALCLALLLALPALAAEREVVPGPGRLAQAIAGADPGDVLILQDGAYPGPVIIDRALTIRGPAAAVIDGSGQGTVITITAADVVLKGFSVTASGSVNEDLDAGVKILKGADRVQILGLTLYDNMHGIDVHGGRDAQVIGNHITGRQNHRMNERGNGI